MSELFNLTSQMGGNILVPVYSYSYTKKEDYSIKDTPSDLGKASDFLRINNYERRTSDALFSYLSFSGWTDPSYFYPNNYESFGTDSLIAKVFEADGYLMSVGGKLHQCTEIHYLEKLLNVSYRMNKDFAGKITTLSNESIPQVITYFCRDMDFAEKYSATVSFERLFREMDQAGLIEKTNIKGELEIEFVRYQQVFTYLKGKLKDNVFYLMKDKYSSGPVGQS